MGHGAEHCDGLERIWAYIVAARGEEGVEFWHTWVVARDVDEAYVLGGRAWDATGRAGFENDYVVEGVCDESVA